MSKYLNFDRATDVSLTSVRLSANVKVLTFLQNFSKQLSIFRHSSDVFRLFFLSSCRIQWSENCFFFFFNGINRLVPWTWWLFFPQLINLIHSSFCCFDTIWFSSELLSAGENDWKMEKNRFVEMCKCRAALGFNDNFQLFILFLFCLLSLTSSTCETERRKSTKSKQNHTRGNKNQTLNYCHAIENCLHQKNMNSKNAIVMKLHQANKAIKEYFFFLITSIE